MVRRSIAFLSVVALIQSSTVAALAAPPAGSSAPATAAPASPSAPDVVRLNNGGLLRGTISELVPGDYVSMVLVTGEVRKLPMADVAYAGPAAGDPSASHSGSEPARAPAVPATPGGAAGEEPAAEGGAAAAAGQGATRPLITVHGREARLSLRGREPGLTYYVKTAAATAGSGPYQVDASGYSVVCTAPCEASMPEGTYVFAVSKNNKRPIAADPVTIAGSTTMKATYEDNSGGRIAGWVIFGGSIAVGTALFVAATVSESNCENEAVLDSSSYPTDDKDCSQSSQRIAGAVVTLVGGALGLVMGLQRDHARISVIPGNVSALHTRNSPAVTGSMTLGERFYNPGLILRTSF